MSSFALQEEYSDFKTLESRLQDVARRLVHRPGGQAPSSSQGAHGLLPNGVFDPSNTQQQQPGAQQLGVQPGTPNPQMMLSAYPGAQGMQPGPGMIPTPNTVVGDSTDLLPVKPEPSNTANAMVPLEGTAADPGSSFQRTSLPGMVPVSGVMGSSSAMGASLMSNGAPIIKQDAWSMPSPNMVQVGSRESCHEGHGMTCYQRRVTCRFSSFSALSATGSRAQHPNGSDLLDARAASLTAAGACFVFASSADHWWWPHRWEQ